MTPAAPRASYLGALRNRGFNTKYHGAVLTNTVHGPTMVPAYSDDSSILGVGFAQAAPGGEGSIFARRTPDEDNGKEATSLGVRGGAAWCPTNNKFYSGIEENGTARAVKIDPLLDFSAELIGGFSPTGNGGRALYHVANDEIWLQAGGGGFGFIRIAPADDSLTTVTCATPTDFTYKTGSGNIYFTTAGAVVKLDSAGASTTLFTQAIFEAALGSAVTAFGCGPIEYVDSLNVVVFAITYTFDPGGGVQTFSNFWQLDSADTPTPFDTATTASMAGMIYYTSQFDRLIIQRSTLLSYDPATFPASPVLLTGDTMSAAKGCFAMNVNKVALPVLTGGSYTVKFYEAGDL
jgi:hypothetical protein